MSNIFFLLLPVIWVVCGLVASGIATWLDHIDRDDSDGDFIRISFWFGPVALFTMALAAVGYGVCQILALLIHFLSTLVRHMNQWPLIWQRLAVRKEQRRIERVKNTALIMSYIPSCGKTELHPAHWFGEFSDEYCWGVETSSLVGL